MMEELSIIRQHLFPADRILGSLLSLASEVVSKASEQQPMSGPLESPAGGIAPPQGSLLMEPPFGGPDTPLRTCASTRQQEQQQHQEGLAALHAETLDFLEEVQVREQGDWKGVFYVEVSTFTPRLFLLHPPSRRMTSRRESLRRMTSFRRASISRS